MECVICKMEEAREGKSTATLERGGTTVVIRAVPARVCQGRGEEYVGEATTDRLLGTAEEAACSGVILDLCESVHG